MDGDGGDPLSDQEDEDAQRGRMSPTDTVDASSHGADADASDGASTPFSPVPRAICETDFVDGDENGPDGEDVGEIDFAAEGDGDDGDDDKPNEVLWGIVRCPTFLCPLPIFHLFPRSFSSWNVQ